jgi:hypothetical protein
MYAVMLLNKKNKVSVNNCQPPLEQEIVMSFADGMVGVLPVFDKLEDAEAYANGANIIEIGDT